MSSEDLVLEEYTLKSKKEDSFDVKEYSALFRYFLLLHKKGIMPDRVSFQQDYSKLIDLQAFAKNRLGLVSFELKEQVPIESLKDISFQLKNETDKPRYVYAKQLQSKFLKPINGSALLLKLPKQTTMKFKIDFICDNGLTHARYSTIEGFRMKTDEQGNQIINFELVNELIEPTLADLIKFLDERIS